MHVPLNKILFKLHTSNNNFQIVTTYLPCETDNPISIILMYQNKDQLIYFISIY